MKTSTITLLVSIGALALAQDLTGLPACAQSAALTGAAGSGCSLTDSECFCKNNGFISSLKTAIDSACTSAADQQAACAWGNNACSAYGVSIPCTDATALGDSSDSMNTSSAPTSETTPAMDAGSSMSTVPADAAGSQSLSMSMPSGSGMTSSMTGSMTTTTMPHMTASSSMTGMMNGTHTSGNATHVSTSMKPSATSAGATSQYTGAGNAAVRHSGVVGTVFGVAMLFAFF